jgi:hypothetical protein
VPPEELSMKNSIDTIGNRSRDLPVCSALPQPLRHSVPPKTQINLLIYWFLCARTVKSSTCYIPVSSLSLGAGLTLGLLYATTLTDLKYLLRRLVGYINEQMHQHTTYKKVERETHKRRRNLTKLILLFLY